MNLKNLKYNNMKQFLLNFRFLAIAALTIIAMSASAKEFTYNFMNTLPSEWTSNPAPLAFESTSRGCQYTSSATLTLKGAKNVTKVVLTCSSNLAGKNTIALKVGGKAYGETVTMGKETNVEKTFTGSASGDITIDITRVDKSVYISKIVVTADEIGSNTGGGDTPGTGTGEGDTDLDPNYTYAEPTIITPTGTIGSNTAYSFVQNNIRVDVSTGGQSESYFGCNAGNSITFTASKNIKAVVVNGYVKKEFEAQSTSGTIAYVDASEDAVETNPVLAITDVDSKTVTITCEKQMRCYSVEFYFVENPELGDDDWGDDEFNFDYEPNVATTLNITFTEMEAEDYSEYFGYEYTDLYFSSEEYEMEVAAFVPYNEETVLAPGTYEINDSYEVGTVQASPGGDDYYDYPTYIATGFQYDAEEDAWYYTQSYYVVSGTLTVSKVSNGTKFEINGKTAKGSTVNASYILPGNADAIHNAKQEEAKTAVGKKILNGRVVIVNKEKVYDASGRRVE